MQKIAEPATEVIGGNVEFGVEAGEVVGHAAGPAGLVEAIQFQRLPLLLLIGVRKKIRGHGQAVGARYCARVTGCDNGPTLARKASLPEVNRVCTSGRLGCKPNEVWPFCGVFEAIGSSVFWASAKPPFATAPRILEVVGVAGGVVGNEQVVGVVAAEEKDAHQRAIVGGALCASALTRPKRLKLVATPSAAAVQHDLRKKSLRVRAHGVPPSVLLLLTWYCDDERIR